MMLHKPSSLPASSVVWMSGLVAGLFVLLLASSLRDSLLHSVVLDGSGEFEPIGSVITPLILSGFACHLVSNDGKDLVQVAALPVRLTLSVLYPSLLVAVTFAAGWVFMAVPASSVGIRNFGVGFLLCAFARLLLLGSGYGVVGLLLLVPAILPGASVAGETLAIVFWPVSASRDVLIGLGSFAAGTVVLILRTRDWPRVRLDSVRDF